MADIGSISFRIEADASQVNMAKAAITGLSDGTIKATRHTGEFSRSYAQLRAQIDPAYRAQTQYNKSIKILDAELRRGNISLNQYSKNVQQLKGQTIGLGRAAGGVKGNFRPMQGAIQQAGYQIGDFAVQVGAGQNALVAFSQQGSQLAGVLGPGGAVLGAVIAIGGALAGAFMRGAEGAADSTEDLIDQLEELKATYEELTSAQRAALSIELEKKMAEQAEQISETEEQLRRAESAAKSYRTALEGSGGTGRFEGLISEEDGDLANERLTTLSSALDTLRLKSERTRERYEELIFGFDASGDSAETAKNEVEQLVMALEAQAAAIGETNKQTDLRIAKENGASEAQLQAIRVSYKAIEAEKERQKNAKEAAKAAAEAVKAQEKFESQIKSLIKQTDPLAKFTETWQMVQKALAQDLITPKQAERVMDSLVKAGEKGGEDAGSRYEESFLKASDRVADSLQDAIITGDWAGVGDTIGASIASGVASAVGNSITESLGDSLGAAGGIIGSLGGALAGGLIGSLLGGDDYVDPTEGRQALQGTGTVFGDLLSKTESIVNSSQMTADATSELVGINRDLANALTRTTAGAGEVAGIAGGFASAAGLNKIIADAGFQFAGTLADATAAGFAETSGIGSFDGAKLQFGIPRLTAAVQETFTAIADSVTEGAQALGIDASDAINRYVIDLTRVSLEGLSAEESKAEIQRVFGVIFDELATNAVPFLEDLQLLGEGLGETLSRVATSVQSVDAAAQALAVSFSGDAGTAARIVEAAGGVSEFNSAVSRFSRTFLTDAEQLENTTRDLSIGLGRINETIPETRAGFATLLREQLSADDQNEDAIATLLRLQGVADEYYRALEDGAESTVAVVEDLLSSVRGATDEALSAVTRSVQAQREAAQEELDIRLTANRMAINAAQEGLRAIEQEVNGIQRATGQLRGQFGPAQSGIRQSALATLRAALSSGDLTGTGDAAQIAATVDESGFATRAAFEKEQAKTLNLLSRLGDDGEDQLTTAERSLMALETQTDVIRREFEQEVGRLDGILENARSQVDALRGIDAGIMSIADAINQLATALDLERPSAIADAYTAAGATQDQTGTAWWEAEIAAGRATIADLEYQLWLASEGASEYAAFRGVPGFANGGMFGGGMRMVGERGPEMEMTGPSRIMSHSDLMQALGGSREMLSELRGMRADNMAAARKIEKNSREIKQIQERWDQQGLPETRDFT